MASTTAHPFGFCWLSDKRQGQLVQFFGGLILGATGGRFLSMTSVAAHSRWHLGFDFRKQCHWPTSRTLTKLTCYGFPNVGSVIQKFSLKGISFQNHFTLHLKWSNDRDLTNRDSSLVTTLWRQAIDYASVAMSWCDIWHPCTIWHHRVNIAMMSLSGLSLPAGTPFYNTDKMDNLRCFFCNIFYNIFQVFLL
jgi:hypothetical protein